MLHKKYNVYQRTLLPLPFAWFSRKHVHKWSWRTKPNRILVMICFVIEKSLASHVNDAKSTAKVMCISNGKYIKIGRFILPCILNCVPNNVKIKRFISII